MKTGMELIAEERARQISVEGWTPKHDDQHDKADLARAAACYAVGDKNLQRPDEQDYWVWPWENKWWNPTPNDRVRELVKAGALIAAEIDRLHRLNTKSSDAKRSD